MDHTGSEQWQSFESRMRRRRVERCLDGWRQAAARGDDAAARVLEAEIKQLDPEWEAPDADCGLGPRDATAPEPTRLPVHQRRLVRVAVTILIGAVALAMGLLAWWPDGVVEPPPETATAPAAVEPAGLQGSMAPVVPVASTGTLPGAGEDAGAVRTVTAPVPPTDAPASPEPAPRRRTDPPTNISDRPDEQRPARESAPATRRTPSAAAMAVPGDAAVRRDISARVAGAASGESASRPTASSAASETAAAEAVIERTLRRYGAAYDALDAGAARQVWPSVDEQALAQAFAGLDSQDIVFDRCRVRVSGDTADASCIGRATYVPKVGSREPRTEPRRWLFELRRQGPDWKIEEAEVRH